MASSRHSSFALSGAADPGSHTQAADLLARRVLALVGRAAAGAV
ncbi:hypothetical protein ACH4TE_18695 [Streptomyces sioyaensis]